MSPSKNQPLVQKRYREREKLKKIANAKPIVTPSNRFPCKSLIQEFTNYTKLLPNPNQTLFLSDIEDFGNHFFILVCARRTGKTLCSAAVLVWHIFEVAKALNRGIKVIIVTPQTKELYDQVQMMFDNNPELERELLYPGALETLPKVGFKLKNGSEVKLIGVSERQVKGPGADLVIIDEAVLISDKIIDKVWGTLSGDINRLILLSTPDAISGKFIEIANNPTVFGFKKYQWSELDNCSWITSDLIEGKKRNLGEHSFEYKTGVLGEIPTLEEKYIFKKLLPKCILPGNIIREGTGRIEAGLDTVESGKRDRIGLVILEISNNNKKKRVIGSISWEGKTMLEALPEIKVILKLEKVSRLRVDLRPIPSCHEVMNEIKDIPVIPINFQGMKGQSIMNLRESLQGHLEIFEESKNLIKEISEYYPKRGKNDDLIDALMVALWIDDVKSTKIIRTDKLIHRWMEKNNNKSRWSNE